MNGVSALGPSSDMYSNALLVLTDGEDTTSGLSDTQVVEAVIRGARFVVAVGEANCDAAALTC